MRRRTITGTITGTIGVAVALWAAQVTASDPIAIHRDGQARFTVPVFVNGRGPFHFVVDSAATSSVISPRVADALALRAAGRVGLVVMDGRAQVSRVRVDELRIGDRVVRDLDLPILDAADVGADGILGADAFQGQRVSMDVRRGRLLINPVGPAASHGLASDRVAADPRRPQLFITDADIDGHPLTVVVDSGSSSSVINPPMYRLLRDQAGPRPTPATLIGVTGDETAVTAVRLQRVRIGNFLFTDAPASAADLSIFRELGLARKPAMLLGMNLLAMFERVDLDFARKRVSFFARRDASDMALAARFAAIDQRGMRSVAPALIARPTAPPPVPAPAAH